MENARQFSRAANVAGTLRADPGLDRLKPVLAALIRAMQRAAENFNDWCDPHAPDTYCLAHEINIRR